jgi:TonB family protein
MLRKLNLWKSAAAILILSMTTIGCNVNDKNEATEASSVSSSDSSYTNGTTVVNIDSTTTTVTTTTSSDGTIAAGSGAVAKPNPAKKGKKGKVLISPAPVPMASGVMEADNTGVYSNVEYIPSFPGGNKGLQAFFDKNIQYPEDASAEGVDGMVSVTFVVDETGRLSSPTTGGQKLGYGLEEEALRVVSVMPNWTPGKLKGKNVKTRYTLPVRFELY